LPPSQIIVMSSAFCCLALAVFSAARGGLQTLVPRQWKVEIIWGLLCVVLSFVNVFCFVKFPLATVYAITFSIPLWVAVGAAVLMREALPRRLGLAIFAGFCGVVFSLGSSWAGLENSGLFSLAVLATFPLLGSANVLLIRFLGRKERVESMSFMQHFMRVIVVLPLFWWQFKSLSLETLAYLVGLGFFSAAGMLLVFAAIKHAPAAVIVPFSYSQIISGAAIGYFFWDEIPAPRLFIGAAVIILSGYYVARHARNYGKVKTLPA